MRIKRKMISLSLPIGVYDMLIGLTQMTYSTKTKVVTDAIRKYYHIYKINTDISGKKDNDVRN